MPMNNEYFDVAPTRGNLRFQATFTGNAFADFLIGYPNRAELTNVFVVDAAAVVELVLRAGRLEADRQADAQSRPALRLHAAGHREGQPAGELRSDRQRRRGRAGVCAGRIARRSRARQPRQEQLRAAHRRHLPHQRQDAAARRLRRVLQPVRSHRLRGSARAQPAGAAQHPGQFRVGRHQPGVLHEGRLPAELSRSVEPGDPQPEAARRDAGRAADAWSSSSAPASSARLAGNMVVSADAVGSFTTPPRGAAQPQSAAARHARCQRRDAVSRISATSRRAR